ncbi:FtsX-like permease family protein [Allokutzneria sp. NRRL B-24872]|uniref:FtsX-like permease family protein n=1 Tax=Allokutzneria sp. NRRL B-24872 TaxID=1137961 RepID=UPI000A3ACB17|nr:FtsX-like permease family protein [Allokutzneria sp. NRRL B-24872]
MAREVGEGRGPLLVRAELLSAKRRTASIAAPIIATVGFAVLLSGMVATMQDAYPAGETAKLRGLAIVVPDGAPGLTDAAVKAVGVGRSPLPTMVFLDRAEFGKTVIGGVGSADSERNGVVLSTSMAQRFGLARGASVPVGFVDGQSEVLKVTSVLPDDPARGDFVLNRDLVRSHDGSALTDTIFVLHDRAPTSVGAGAAVHDGETFAVAKYEKENRLLLQLSLVLIFVAVGYTGIAMANTMAMAAQSRAAAFAVLKSACATARQVVRLVIGETALVVVVGVVLGLLVTLPPLAAMASGLAEATGTSVSLRLDWPIVVLVPVSCLVLAVARACS